MLVLATTLVAGRWLFLPDAYATLGKDVASASVFASNITLWNDAGYFTENVALRPLTHLWSLAIEEQFYLLFPVLLIAAHRRWRLTGGLVALLLAASFGWNLHTTGVDQAAAFYLLPSRFWELVLGAALAYAQLTWGSRLARGLANTSFPLLVIARVQWGPSLSVSVTIAIVALSVALAYATYRLVELPVRGLFSRGMRPRVLVAPMAAGCAGLAVFLAAGLPGRLPAEVQRLTTVAFDHHAAYRRAAAFSSRGRERAPSVPTASTRAPASCSCSGATRTRRTSIQGSSALPARARSGSPSSPPAPVRRCSGIGHPTDPSAPASTPLCWQRRASCVRTASSSRRGGMNTPTWVVSGRPWRRSATSA